MVVIVKSITNPSRFPQKTFSGRSLTCNVHGKLTSLTEVSTDYRLHTWPCKSSTGLQSVCEVDETCAAKRRRNASNAESDALGCSLTQISSTST